MNHNFIVRQRNSSKVNLISLLVNKNKRSDNVSLFSKTISLYTSRDQLRCLLLARLHGKKVGGVATFLLVTRHKIRAKRKLDPKHNLSLR